jgi:hypothetical protein
MNDNVGLWFRMVRANGLVIDVFESSGVLVFVYVVCCATVVLNALL